MAVARAINLGAKFALELASVVVLAYWGQTVRPLDVGIALAVLVPLAVILLWAVLAAPTSAHRLPTVARVPFELGVFALAAVALGHAASPTAAIVFAGVAAVNAFALFALGELRS